jgi:hypothetical protein
MLTSDEISCQGDKIRRHGACSLHLDAIAARAGVCRTTVQNALRQARAVRLVTLEYGVHEHIGGCKGNVARPQCLHAALSGDAVEVREVGKGGREPYSGSRSVGSGSKREPYKFNRRSGRDGAESYSTVAAIRFAQQDHRPS